MVCSQHNHPHHTSAASGNIPLISQRVWPRPYALDAGHRRARLLKARMIWCSPGTYRVPPHSQAQFQLMGLSYYMQLLAYNTDYWRKVGLLDSVDLAPSPHPK